MSNELDYDFNKNAEDLTPQIKTFKMGETQYQLSEASENATVAWRNMNVKAAKMRDGKVVGMEGIADSEPFLVHLCLQQLVNGNWTRVPLDTIRGWPSRIVQPMFDWIKKVSGLTEEKETVETLEKKLKEIQDKLKELKRGDTDPKEQQSSTTHTFD